MQDNQDTEPSTKYRVQQIFRIRPDQPWGPPNLPYDGHRVIPEGKAGGGEAWH
jgi:hypothetical protein